MKKKKINRITLKSTDIDEFALLLKNVDVENILMEKGEFNVKMRNVAIKQGYSLSDQGIKIGDNKGDDIEIKEYELGIERYKLESEKSA